MYQAENIQERDKGKGLLNKCPPVYTAENTYSKEVVDCRKYCKNCQYREYGYGINVPEQVLHQAQGQADASAYADEEQSLAYINTG